MFFVRLKAKRRRPERDRWHTRAMDAERVRALRQRRRSYEQRVRRRGLQRPVGPQAGAGARELPRAEQTVRLPDPRQ
ncbi:MAG: hypothetical protein LC799_16360 [Actinobacteria bacterium]|nr:hypothetical protein [Actinomycetota bacterium]